MSGSQMRRDRALAEALWKTVILFYQDPEDRSGAETIRLPQIEAANAFVTCLANLVAQIEDARIRNRLVMGVAPMLDRAVAESRSRPGLLTGAAPIVLPRGGIDLGE